MISRSKRHEEWSGTQGGGAGMTTEEGKEQAGVEASRLPPGKRHSGPPRGWGPTLNRGVLLALYANAITAVGFASSLGATGSSSDPTGTPGGAGADVDSCVAAPFFVKGEDAWPTCGLDPPEDVGAASTERVQGAAVTETTATTTVSPHETSSSGTVGTDDCFDAEEGREAGGRSDDDAESTATVVEAAAATAAAEDQDAKGVAHLTSRGGRVEADSAASVPEEPASPTDEAAAAAPTSFPPAGDHGDSGPQGAAEEQLSSETEVDALPPSSARRRAVEGGTAHVEEWNEEETSSAAFPDVITAEREALGAPGTLKEVALEVEANEKDGLLITPTAVATQGAAGGATIMSSEAGSAAAESAPIPPPDAPGHASLPATEVMPGELVVDVLPLPPVPEGVTATVDPEAVPPESDQQVQVDSVPSCPLPLPLEIFGQDRQELVCPARWSSPEEEGSVVEPPAGGGAPQHEAGHVPSAPNAEAAITDTAATLGEETPRVVAVHDDEPAAAATVEADDPAPGDSAPQGTASAEVDRAPASLEAEGGTTSATTSDGGDEHVPGITSSDGATSALDSAATTDAGASPAGTADRDLPPREDGPRIAAAAATQGATQAETLTSSPTMPPGGLAPDAATAKTASSSPSPAASEEEQDLGTGGSDAAAPSDPSHPLSPTSVADVDAEEERGPKDREEGLETIDESFRESAAAAGVDGGGLGETSLEDNPALSGDGAGRTCRGDDESERSLAGHDEDEAEKEVDDVVATGGGAGTGAEEDGETQRDDGGTGERDDVIIGGGDDEKTGGGGGGEGESGDALGPAPVPATETSPPHSGVSAADEYAESAGLDDTTNAASTMDQEVNTPFFPSVVLGGAASREAEPVWDDDDANGDDGDAGLEILVREFNDWVATVEFPVRKVEAGLVGDGMRLGLVATEAIEGGRPYLSVPESIVLDATKARNDPELGPPIAKLEDLLAPQGLWDEDGESLRILLIAEAFVRADASPWASYLRLLPKPSDVKATHPLFYDDATITAFEGSDVQGSLRHRRDSEVAGFSRKFIDEGSVGGELEDVLGVGSITLERYLWATAILDTRCIWWEGRRHLVPLLDLVNDAQGDPSTPIQKTFQDSEGYAVTFAAKSFDRGAQVFEDYGHPNHLLLSVHGFSLGRENDHDCVRIDAQRPSRGAAEYPQTLARLQQAFPEGRPVFCISLPGKDSRYFISYVRIMAGLSAIAEKSQTSSADRGTEGFASAGTTGIAEQDKPAGVSIDCDEGMDCSRSPLADPSEASVDTHQEPSHTCTPEADGPIHVSPAPSCGRAADEGWETIRNDLEALKVVLDALNSRLSQHPYSEGSVKGGGSWVAGGSGDEDAVDAGGAGRATGVDNSGDGVSSGTGRAEGAARVFLDSEGFLLQELHDYIEAMLPLNEVSMDPQEHPSETLNNNSSGSSFPEKLEEEEAACRSTSGDDHLPGTEVENAVDGSRQNDDAEPFSTSASGTGSQELGDAATT